MKKIFIYVSVIGIMAGVVYWLRKKEKNNNVTSELAYNKENFQSKTQEEKISQGLNVVEEMYQSKEESVQAVSERHFEAAEIMKDSYRNIMEDFVEDFSSEKVEKEKDGTKEVVVHSEFGSVIKEIDSISDELDDLLK